MKRTDFKEIRGQEMCKRAILIALAGNHPIILYGSPGQGKTMLIDAACSILPKLRKNFSEVTLYGDRYLDEQKRKKTFERLSRRPHDLSIEVPAVPFRELSARRQGTDSEAIEMAIHRSRVFVEKSSQSNDLSDECLTLMKQAYDELGLNPAAYAAIVRVSRTIANLAEADRIGVEHLAEAVQYQTLRRRF